ncbi:hypothetical protein GCM10010353_73310 [Streptomyces chryseus]|nr:hypothetical protein GCM10010353_73310 [Streptomyces chryseus]
MAAGMVAWWAERDGSSRVDPCLRARVELTRQLTRTHPSTMGVSRALWASGFVFCWFRFIAPA